MAGARWAARLSWETPKRLAPFDRDSPFFGLAAPDEVTISRQVLAEPEPGLAGKTWARLADGTPLVTADRRGKGLIVLFHVTADTTWSNLPLSGLFVDMLRKIVALAGAVAAGQERRLGLRRGGRREPARPRARSTASARSGAPPVTAKPIAGRFFRGRRRRSSAGLLRLGRCADRGQRAGAVAGAGAGELWPADGRGGRARRSPSRSICAMAARRRVPRLAGRRCGEPLARRRVRPASRRDQRSGAAGAVPVRGSGRRPGVRRRTGADLAARHGRGACRSIWPMSSPATPAVDETSRVGARQSVASARAAHVAVARRADRPRSGARRTELLSADLLARRRGAAAARDGRR